MTDSADALLEPISGAAASLANGELGRAFALVQLAPALADDEFGSAARTALSNAVAHWREHTARDDLSLYQGVAGFCLVLADFADHDSRYAPALRRTVDDFALAARTRLVDAHDSAGPRVGRMRDLIDGATGWFISTLRLRRSAELESEQHKALAELTDLLIDLLTCAHEPRSAAEAHFIPTDRSTAVAWYRDLYPRGHYPLGMAHGVAGTLAVLAGALVDGVEHPALRPAVAELAAWLAQGAVTDEYGLNWLGALGRDERGQPAPDPRHHVLSGWCKGTAGTAAALAISGAALGDAQLARTACDALLADRSRRAAQGTQGAGLCHGLAGIASLESSIGALLHNAALTAAGAADLAAAAELGRGVQLPRGLLNGVDGLALALGTDPGARWTRVLALTGATPEEGT